MQKIYVVQTNRSFKIEPCIIIKETEKTYVVSMSRFSRFTIKKGEMRNWYGVFVFGKKNAFLAREKLIKDAIEGNKNRLCYITTEIDRLQKQLVEAQKATAKIADEDNDEEEGRE